MRFNHCGVIGEITTLPGCTQIAVSHSVFVPTQNRGKGLGQAAHKDRLSHAEYLGYDVMMCTVDMSNEPQLKILSHNGWVKVHEFVSSKTGHIVGVYFKDLV